MAFVDHETTETHTTEEFKKSFQVFFLSQIYDSGFKLSNKYTFVKWRWSNLSKTVSFFQPQQMEQSIQEWTK